MKDKITRRQFAKVLGMSSTALFLSPTLSFSQASEIDYLEGKFKPDFESLKQYQCPEWFRDYKFGIFLHWGVNSVPGFNGHYGRYMYWQSKPENVEGTGWSEKGSDVYDHHVKNYGHPSKFGYKDFIPMWKAEKFDADKLAKFFKKIGAKYVVPMAVHHDNFDNWDSKYHKWNSVNMGPKRDIIGEWKKACQDNDLRFGVSSHFNGGHENVFFQGASDFTGPLARVPYDSADPIHDTYLNAAFVLNTLKMVEGITTSMSYWVFTDVFEEPGVPKTPFHGGFGLVNLQGIKKPTFYTYHYLNQLGNTELVNPDSCSWVCKQGDNLQILLWDLSYPDQGDEYNQVYFRKEHPAKEKGTVEVKVENMKDGIYALSVYQTGYKHNDAFTAYYEMGLPSQLTRGQENYLKEISSDTPVRKEIIELKGGVFSTGLKLRENDIFLLKLDKM